MIRYGANRIKKKKLNKKIYFDFQFFFSSLLFYKVNRQKQIKKDLIFFKMTSVAYVISTIMFENFFSHPLMEE